MRSSPLRSQTRPSNTGHTGPQSPRLGTPARLSGEQCSVLREYQLLWDRLALRLLRSQEPSRPLTVGLTSAIPGEGKTTASIGLAIALAQEGPGNVALVEADFRNPTLARDFGAPGGLGLMDHLLGRCPLLELSRATHTDRLRLFPAGEWPHLFGRPTSGRLNGQLRHRFQGVVEQLGKEFSCVVLDLPPILGNIDTEEILTFISGVILVARNGVTPLEKFRQATQRLESGKLLGVVHLGGQGYIPRWLARLISE